MAKWMAFEDEYLRQHRDRLSVKKLAAALGRGEDAVKNRLVRLGLVAESLGAPLRLGDDKKLVAACLAEGGFPRAVVHAGKTFWVAHDGQLWRRDMAKVAA